MTIHKDMTEQEFKIWNDGMAEKYNPDQYHRGSNAIIRWVERSRVKKILDYLESTSQCSVLEVGVGAGNILVQVPAREAWGLDLNAPLLALATQRLPSATLIQGNAEHFSSQLNGKVFDRVFCSEVLEHVQHPRRVVENMARVVAPNGIVVISVPNERVINMLKRWLERLRVFRLLFSRVSRKMDDEWHLHAFDEPMLRQVVQDFFIFDKLEAVPYRWLPIRLVAKLIKRV